MTTFAIDAVYENGVFRPVRPVLLPEGSLAKVYASSEREGEPHIVQTPGVCGGRARLSGTRITVWGLVEHRRLGLDDIAILEAVVGLTPEELAVALLYAAEHPDEIDRDLAENSA